LTPRKRFFEEMAISDDPTRARAKQAEPMPIVLRATVFLVLVCLSLLAADIWRSLNARAIQLREATVSTANYTRLLAQHADDTITAADTILVDLVERIEVDGSGSAQRERLRRLLATHAQELPSLHGIFIYDEQGRWLVNSMPQPGTGKLNNADREYFIFHREHRARGPHIGLAIQSRTTDDWIIPVSRRIEHPDGSFAGVALTTINMDYFKKYYTGVDIGQDGAIVFAHDNGKLLLRLPFDDGQIGKDLTGSPLFKRLSNERSGSAIFTAKIDGVERVYSYQHLERYPLVIAVAQSRKEVLAAWRANTYLHSGGVALLAIILALLGVRLIRQIGLRAQAEARLQQSQQELQASNQTLQAHALQDGLTGLANRRSFDAGLREEWERALRHGRSLALIMLDADYFKQYNDTYGHPAGDACLRSVAQAILAGQSRPGDLSARYGGEEMAVLLPDTDLDGALAVAERIRTAILALQIAHAGSPFGMVTISAGVAACMPVQNSGSAAQLLEAADRALYLAKTGGRNRCCTSPN
jgi:diguanylate cyclase (GGDEF)-like protein